MRVFVTGATGWVGSRVVKELIAAGHKVAGMSRSDAKAAGLTAAGAEVVRGSLDDLDTLKEAGKKADAVIHLAFSHDDMSKFAENAEQDRKAILALGEALEGTGRPLLVTSGLAMLAEGRIATEKDVPKPAFPRKSEAAAQEVAKRGVKAAVVRFPPSVHGVGETHGFVPMLIATARKTGVSAYIEKGENRWAGTHVTDVAKLYRLILEKGVTEPVYHAVAEEAVPFKAIAEVIGRRLGLPVESRPGEHFGGMAHFFGADMAGSSEHTRKVLGWTPTGPGLLADIDQPGYFAG